MPAFNPRVFSSPESLKKMREDLLICLLTPHIGYLHDRGIDLDGGALNHEQLSSVLMRPNESTPAALLDDLYFVDEMASHDAMAALQDEIERLPLKEQELFSVDDDISPADLAIQVRLKLPELLERKHAERVIYSRRTFAYFRSRSDRLAGKIQISSQQINALEADLATRFESLRRGPRAKVFVFDRGDGTWLLVRRGDPLTRDAATKEGVSSSIVYRPERYDVFHIDFLGESLALNVVGDVKKIREAYIELIGQHMLGDASDLSPTDRYTLEPLRSLDPEVLGCSDIEGIESVVLKELSLYWGGAHGETEIRRSKDLLASFRSRTTQLPAARKILRATFSITFTGTRAPRSVTIQPPDRVSYSRDSDALALKEWFVRRGFLVNEA